MEHHFDTDIAKEYGIEEAIILYNLFFWISKNAANGKNFHDGSYWTYNSVAGYTELFPYMNAKKIRGVLNNLAKAGLIKIGNYNTNKMDRTSWYAFTDEGISILAEHGYVLGKCNAPKKGNAFTQNGKMDDTEMVKCITYNNTDKKQEDNNNIKPTNVGMSQSDPQSQDVDFERLKNCFNDILSKQGSLIPKLASITDKRRHAINARIKEHGKVAVFNVFKKAAASALLNGRNNRSFVASFDWLMKPNNFVKVLEGNYDDSINNMYNGNNRADIEREQRRQEAADIIARLWAEDDARAGQQGEGAGEV